MGPVAATPVRPAYDGARATGWSAAVAWGMRVKSAWLLTGKLGIENYGSGISASPIVDDGDRSFLSLQISYDQPLFRVPGEPAFRSRGAGPGVELLLGLADVDAESWLTGSDSGEWVAPTPSSCTWTRRFVSASFDRGGLVQRAARRAAAADAKPAAELRTSTSAMLLRCSTTRKSRSTSVQV